MHRLIIVFSLVFNFCVINSQEKVEKKILPDILILELKSITQSDQKYRSIIVENRESLSKKDKDSLWVLQDEIDINNTIRVIEIIKEYGYISSSNSNSNFPMHIILMHTPNNLKSEVLELIEKENRAGRIVKSSYGLIKWHLEGRKEVKLDYFKKNDSTN
ncbi:hypothetical protein [uncultured Winogradskyella sp.]|uniref:hypothetical protein n=1 Tax=uncultured Winogradskyella sp. TaxID=395353 RepID=UPI0026133068|nr:hypothetical protein [uncultured Winogradskyella sp.]